MQATFVSGDASQTAPLLPAAGGPTTPGSTGFGAGPATASATGAPIIEQADGSGTPTVPGGLSDGATQVAASPPPPTSSESFNGMAIAGGVIGGVISLAVLAAAAFLLLYRRRLRTSPPPPLSETRKSGTTGAIVAVPEASGRLVNRVRPGCAERLAARSRHAARV
jgi:hypothetical protein